MKLKKRTHRQLTQLRKRSRQKYLQLERLEDRVVLAGDSPVAFNDFFEAVKDQPLEVVVAGVLANDTDAEGDLLSAIEFQGPLHGSLALDPSGSFIYTPDPSFAGIDGFLYSVNDGTSSSHLAAVTIQVEDINSAPVAVEDSYSTLEDQALTVDSANGVLVNDTDVNGDPLTVALVAEPTHGTVVLNPDGSFEYTPNENFSGSDSFTYEAFDGLDTSSPVVVSIEVAEVNDVPIASNDLYETIENTTLVSVAADGVLANDSDVDGTPLTAILFGSTTNGTLTLESDGSFVYTPDANFNGVDAFSYQAFDGTALSDLVVVELVVAAVNDAPVAINDHYTVNNGEPLTVDASQGVLANDSDPNGDSLETVLFREPQNGTLALLPDGSFDYTPNTGFSGLDSFFYRATDQNMLSRLAIVQLQGTSDATNADSSSDENPLDTTVTQATSAEKVDPGPLDWDSSASDEFFETLDVGEMLDAGVV